MKAKLGQMGMAALVGLALVVLAVVAVQWGETPTAEAAPLAQATRAVLTPTNITRSPGTTVTLTAAVTAGHKFRNTGKEFVYIYNGSGSTITATFETPGTVDGLDVADLEVPVAAGTRKLIGPFTDLYEQSGTNLYRVYVDYSAVTTVTVGVFQLWR